MGEVAVISFEPLQFESNDVKHMTEKNIFTGEESSESKDHEKTNDLQDKGYMEHGCTHYRRRCRIRAPCCSEIFGCRHCHNDAKVHQNCINCGVCMGKYFCGTCKLFDDDISKHQYHCSGFGFC